MTNVNKKQIRKVAEKAGVSVATVSRVLNNYPFVKDETRARVTDVIKKYNYSPSYFGRALSKKRSENICLVIPMNFSTDSQYFMDILRGMTEAIAVSSYNLLFPPVCSDEHFMQNVADKIDSAVFMAPPVNDKKISLLKEAGKPVVVINSRIEDAPRIDINNRKAVRKMMNYLIKLGHNKIGLIAGYLKSPNAAERLDEYKKTLYENNLQLKKEWVLNGDYETKKTYKKVRNLFSGGKEKPTALFACNDTMAISAIKALKDSKIRVPEDITVTGFDDIFIARYTSPSLTTIKQPFIDMGSKAVESAIALMNNKKLDSEEIILDTKLIVRQSSKEIK